MRLKTGQSKTGQNSHSDSTVLSSNDTTQIAANTNEDSDFNQKILCPALPTKNPHPQHQRTWMKSTDIGKLSSATIVLDDALHYGHKRHFTYLQYN